MPQYADDILREIADIKRRLDVLYTAATTRRPITSFSQPITLANSSQPSAPSGGCAIYAVSGELRVIYSDGTVHQIAESPFTQGPPVPDMPVFNSPSSPEATTDALQAAYKLLRDDCQSGIRANVIALKNSLEAGGFIPS